MTFESLYNWGISREWAEVLDIDHLVKNAQSDSLYFLRLTRRLTQVHALVLCEKFDEAQISIDKLLPDVDEIQNSNLEDEKICTKVLTHVTMVTIQKSYDKMNEAEKAEEMKQKISPLVTTELGKSTLYGIRSFCLYQYYQAIHIARNFAENARKLNPDCSYWNLIYALCLRDERRDSGTSKPGFLEKKYFYIAYTLNAHPYFGIRLAQCYKESGDQEKAQQMYHEIKQLDFVDSDIWLRLALGFIYYNKLEDAKECLDEAEKIDDSLTMFHHYKGLYYMKGFKNYDEAMIHLKRSSEHGNYKAFMDYLSCIYRKDPNDRRVIEILEDSIDKYKQQQFEIGLSIALYYGKNLKDYEKALIKLRETVEQNPQDDHLRDFFYTFTDKFHHVNIYQYIERELLPRSRRMLDAKNRDAWDAFNFLKNLAQSKNPRRNNFSNNPRTD